MRAVFWPTLIAGVLTAGQAQGQKPARLASSGVFTNAQAAKGKDLFAGMCQSCHTPASHTGGPFHAKWGGKPLSELYGFIATMMPQTDPGSMTSSEYAQIVAYLLRLNGLPAGATELPADSTQLRAIMFDPGASGKAPSPNAPARQR